MILLAVIASAHGIKGAVKVKTFTQSPENVVSYGTLRDENGKPYKLKLIRLVSSDSLIATIEGVSDRNQAEALRGTKLYIERDQLPSLVEEEYYHSDLIGLRVCDLEGKEIGRVTAINNYGAGDFIDIMDSAHHIYTIPFTHEAVPVVSLNHEKAESGVLQVNRRFLLDSALQNTESNDE